MLTSILVLKVALVLVGFGLAVAMSSVGPQAYGAKTGTQQRLSADGNPRYKVGGHTIDWTHASIPVAGAGGITLADGTFVPAGIKYILRGTPMIYVIDGDGKQGLSHVALAADGAGLVVDRTWLTNETVVQTDYMSDHAGGLLNGGRVWRARIQAAGIFPTLAQIRAACPLLELVED